MNPVASKAPGADESCQAGAGHDCCHKAKADGGEATQETTVTLPSSDMSCCPLVGQPAEFARQVRLLDAPQVLSGNVLLPAPGVEPYRVTISARLPVRDRGSTYLRCCVFLI